MRRDLCLFCGHFILDLGCDDYSDLTPGEPIFIGCWKGHWSMDQNSGGAEEYREHVKKAKECKDFQHYKKEA